MDKLAPKLIRRAMKKQYIAIIIDPIYKVITGDENSADQMANFCNQFDKVCTELGCAVIYCHHHSKGSQGQKRSMDRASGSGVFARDPDAMLDMIELETTEELRKQEGDKAALNVCKQWLERCVKDWEAHVSQDDLCSYLRTLTACQKLLSDVTYRALLEAVEDARQAASRRSAWRIEGTLREFPRFAPVNLWFDYPIHHVDMVGSLADIEAEGEAPYRKGSQQNQKNTPSRRKSRLETLQNAMQLCDTNGKPTTKKVAEYLDVAPSTVRKWISEYSDDFYIDKNDGLIKEKGVNDDGE